MASTVSWDSLRDLAGFRAQNGCAISLYLDLDPSDTPTAATADTRVNALIDEIERSEAARRPELTHEQREGLRKRRRSACGTTSSRSSTATARSGWPSSARRSTTSGCRCR